MKNLFTNFQVHNNGVQDRVYTSKIDLISKFGEFQASIHLHLWTILNYYQRVSYWLDWKSGCCSCCCSCCLVQQQLPLPQLSRSPRGAEQRRRGGRRSRRGRGSCSRGGAVGRRWADKLWQGSCTAHSRIRRGNLQQEWRKSDFFIIVRVFMHLWHIGITNLTDSCAFLNLPVLRGGGMVLYEGFRGFPSSGWLF